MRHALSVILLGAGMLGMLAIWIITSVTFFSSGQTVLGLIALVVPPADLVLPFVISPLLGLLGIGSTLVAFAGSALRRDA